MNKIGFYSLCFLRIERKSGILGVAEARKGCYDCGENTLPRPCASATHNHGRVFCVQRDTEMGNFRDLTGQSFGRLTALRPTEKRSGCSVVWECHCDCGNIVHVSSSALVAGNTQSCGCFQKECASRRAQLNGVLKRRDLTGVRFGRLVGLNPIQGRTKSGGLIWECLCDCGAITRVAVSNLTSGSVQSCGCLQKENAAEHARKLGGHNRLDLSNRRFGKLTALRESKYRPRLKTNVGWLCRCDCGNFKIVASRDLTWGDTTSCGCGQRERLIQRNTTHGLSRTKEYDAMKSRGRQERKRVYDGAWTVEMEFALRALQPMCVVCGSTDRLCVDHVLPLSGGNGLKPGNAVVLCRHCNSVKGNRSLGELPSDMTTKITRAAQNFKISWEQCCE